MLKSSLELQVKDAQIDELQKEARLRGNQLLELVETTSAARSSRDEAMKEKDVALERAQAAEEKLLQASEHARQAEERAEASQRTCKGLKRDLRLARHNIQLPEASTIDGRSAGIQLGFEAAVRVRRGRFPEQDLSDLRWDDHLPRSEAGTPLAEQSDRAQGGEDLVIEEAFVSLSVLDQAEGEGISRPIIVTESATSMGPGTRQSGVDPVLGQQSEVTTGSNILRSIQEGLVRSSVVTKEEDIVAVRPTEES